MTPGQLSRDFITDAQSIDYINMKQISIVI